MTPRSPAARREAHVVAWSAATLFAVGWATISITNVSEALFLKRVGVTRLPAVFLVNSVLLFLTTAMIGRLGARTDALRLLPRVLLGLALSLVPLWVLVVANQTSAFVLLVIAAKQLSSIAMVVFWVALGGLVDGRQAKRLYAPISAGGTLGAIAGSFASGPLGRTLGVQALVGVTGFALVLAALAALPLLRLAPARLDVGARPMIVPPRPARSAMALLWREGPLFRALVVSAVLSGLLGPMLYFQFSYVADLATQGTNGEQRLLALYAWFRGWINVAVLACQVAGTSWLFHRIGVPLAASMAPGVYLLGFAGLGVRLALPAGLAAVAAASVQDHAVFDPAQRTLATLVPARHRAAAIAAIEGPARRFGGVLGNALVMVALAIGTPVGVGRLGLASAAVWLVLALRLWRAYPTLLLGALARPARDAEQLPLRELLDAGTLRALETSLLDPDPARCRAACGIVADAPPPRAVPLLARAVRRAPEATRGILVETLHRLAAVAPPSRAAAADVAALLDAPTGLDGATRARLLQTYARLAAPLAPGSDARARVARHRTDAEPAVRLAAAALADEDGTASDAVLAAALAGDDPTARAVAVAGLRAALLAPPDARFVPRLALLAHALDAPTTRASAAAALADVAEEHAAHAAGVGPALLAHREDDDPRVRVAALRAVGALHLAAEASWAVERLAAGHPDEHSAARTALETLGPEAAPALLAALRSGRRPLRDAVIGALGDVQVERPTLDALLDAEIDTLRRLAVQRWALDETVADLVLARLDERGREAAQSAILLLAARRHDPRLAALARLAGRVEDARDRGVLLEALEALLSPGEQARLLPLIEDRDAGTRATAAARALRVRLPSPDEALAAALADDDVLTRSFLVETLDPEVVARHDGRLPLPPGTEPGRALRLASGVGIGEDPPGAPRMLSRVEIVLHLRSLALFDRLTTGELSDLATIVREERRPAGETIVREGDFDDSMFLVVSGEVDVARGGLHLATTGAGEFFGEMAVLDGETRSADVVARTAVHLLRLERADLFRLMDEQPSIAIAICRTLSRRIRNLLAAGDAPKA